MTKNSLKKPKVVILCGGLGTRLREETEFKPKPMIEIGDKPILWHIMKIYSYFGFNEFILCLGYKGDVIKEYFYNYKILNNDFTIVLGDKESIQIHHNKKNTEDWEVTLVDTGKKTLKGARIKKIEKFINEDLFMVTYGDGVGNVNINKLLSFHKKHRKLATLTGVNPFLLRFGELKTKRNKVVSFKEKPNDNKKLINGGFFVFNKKIFKYLTEDDDCDLEFGPLEKLVKKHQMMVYKHKGFWACMDTLRDMYYLNELWNKNKADWKIW
jgi:glucose-1-phosphate cytidylyltransferase